ncbi:hypothetical protein DIU31_014465 [Mucilaginibacter rubeus]|uniref:Uncharacterized protein n=1 Tax=Mucilaginibacter rubeus TaxID=2027860 RepID=A0AAE6MIZ5_9SPHI|nr:MULTISPECIES: hypothetical protein [Mucilaginibacter]QEM04657.1 hypothetical protein DIU31_014465 [Mucilaginibacter rubeus]QEM17251.1 hypothetical protein DIU38_014615 [Mucilaginibacter gossypii]QTE46240.1 hypothetical protein J3L19_13080 [Mucilaginibacter rubeus]QTE52837.1 hypothetical protein J3L21_13055 [Mucilaginibacter rubeus]QTE57924.1 hypothetical protein J3L23_04730 [Mucilaginibacter rubeus]
MPTTPQSYNLLLEVFYWGLQWGLIPKADVVKWADDIIIATEDIPDYFFIELSMSRSITEAMMLIKDEISISNATIIGNALLGLIYHKLNSSNLELQQACNIMDRIASNDTMAGYEKGMLYQFCDEFQEAFRPEHFDNLRTDILDFLILYKDFTLHNYHEWPTITERTETHKFNAIQQVNEENEAYAKEQKQTAAAHKFTIKLVLYTLILGAEIVIIAKPNLEYKFNRDMYALSLLVFGIAMCYPFVWIIYRSLIKLFRV